MNKAEITHLVFDLGGVIVQLRGLPVLNEWTGANDSYEAVWHKWLTSEAPRLFEAGKIDRQDFAQRIVSELALNTSEQVFLDYFSTLPVATFPGAIAMLTAVRKNYTTALFSNSNEIHWALKMRKMELEPVFDVHFASHIMGLVKPDKAAFEHVVATLDVDPARILFFDDNQLNVDAARQTGMQAERVVGFDELEQCMREKGIRWD